MTSPRARAELERLITDGLDRYRRGDVDGALAAWESALHAVPGDPRALGYVDYVRQHYEHLLVGAPSPIAELLVPFELGATEDPGGYEKISISGGVGGGGSGGGVSAGPGSWRGARLAEPAINDGWPIEGERTGVGAAKPAAPIARPIARPAAPIVVEDDYESLTLGQAGRSDPALVPPPPDDSGEATIGGYQRDVHQRPTVDLAFDFGGREVTGEPTLEQSSLPPPRRIAPLGAAPLVSPSVGRARTPDTLRGGAIRPPAPPRPAPATAPPRPAPAPAPPPLDPLDDLDLDLGLGLSLDLDLPGSPLELGIETMVPGPEPTGTAPAVPADDRAVHVEELRLPPPTTGRMQAVDNVDADEAPPLPPLSSLGGPSMQLMAEVDRDRPARETVDDAARRRITRLIDRARTAALAGDPTLVIVAIELALGEAPDSAVAQKLIQKNRDVLLDCYYRCFGSLDRRPIVTGSLSELQSGAGRAAVDPRAAFLLSRIDGMLTFDELLDVAGMGRLEACRHLANLMGRGLVRST